MSNGQDDEKSKQDTTKKKSGSEKTLEATSSLGKTASELGKTIETLFGPPSPAPFTPSTVRTGPPQVSPSGSGPGGFSTSGAGGGGLPQAPQGTPSPQPGGVGALQTGTEFSTDRGARGATVAGALSSVVGALHNIESTKKQEKIQHAQFLYDLVKSAYESGDQQTANVILQDDKNRKLIEKYLTGNLPRVPGQAMGETPAPLTKGGPATGSVPIPLDKGKVGQINEPGGIALPRPSQESQMNAAVQNIITEGLKNKDPRIMDKVFGAGTSLSKEDYSTAMKSKFGIELSPAQVQALDAKSQLALAETKADVLKYVIGQTAMSDRMIAVAKIHAGADVEVGAGHDKARLQAARDYRDFLVKLKGSPADKMEQVMYQGLSKLYTDMARNSITQAGKIQKDDPKIAKQFEDEAKQYVMKAEGMKAQYEAGKFLDDILKGGVPSEEGGDSEPDDEQEEKPN